MDLNPLTGNDAEAQGGPKAAPVVAGQVAESYAEKLIAARDTLIVFSMQVVFRATMFLRHLNY